MNSIKMLCPTTSLALDTGVGSSYDDLADSWEKSSFIVGWNNCLTSQLACAPMTRSSKLVVPRGSKVLLVKRRSDGRWMFPGGKRKRSNETPRSCLKREISEELPELKVRTAKRWLTLDGRHKKTGRKMSDAVFLACNARGGLMVGDKTELAKAAWRKPWGLKLTPTSRHIIKRLVQKGHLER